MENWYPECLGNWLEGCVFLYQRKYCMNFSFPLKLGAEYPVHCQRKHGRNSMAKDAFFDKKNNNFSKLQFTYCKIHPFSVMDFSLFRVVQISPLSNFRTFSSAQKVMLYPFTVNSHPSSAKVLVTTNVLFISVSPGHFA